MTFLCFQGEPSASISKVSILGGLRRRVEVRGSPGHQEQGKTRKRGNARACMKPHGRAPKTGTTQPARDVARPGRDGWPGRAKVAVVGLKSLAIIFFGASFPFGVFPLLFLLF